MYHHSNLGIYAHTICDLNGYVPEATDTDPWAFAIDHGDEATHYEDGELTEYGQWWAEEGFSEWRDRAVAKTRESEAALREWQEQDA